MIKTFSDVMLIPKYSDVMSRSQVDTSCNLNSIKMDLPVISANMKDITGYKMAIEMVLAGGMGILHRFDSIDQGVMAFQASVEYLNSIGIENPNVGVSIGVKDDSFNRFLALKKVGAKIVCIDVAHGHHILVKNMIDKIRDYESKKKNKTIIIAGNVATAEGAKYLENADIVKVGIGPGSCCTTRRNTGCGYPQLSALEEIRNLLPNICMISDGGIKTYGDIAKALVYADAVMIGSLFAGTSETPGHVFEDEKGHFYKVYGGSASGENKVVTGRNHQHVEGIIKKSEFRGQVKYILKSIKQNLQSSLSYVGAMNLQDFKSKAEFTDMISVGSIHEGA